MARRFRAREVALQLLFQRDQNKVELPRPAAQRFCRDRLREPDLVTFALALFDGSVANKDEVDKLITATAENWRLHRMMPVDRNVLRLGTFELLHDPDRAPVAVVINEAIELARRFGTADSPAFVNGILDKIAQSRKPAAPKADAPPASQKPDAKADAPPAARTPDARETAGPRQRDTAPGDSPRGPLTSPFS